MQENILKRIPKIQIIKEINLYFENEKVLVTGGAGFIGST